MRAHRDPAPLPPPPPSGRHPLVCPCGHLRALHAPNCTALRCRCGAFGQEPEPELISPERVELLGLGVMVAVLERMSPAERRRSLAYLNDRYGGGQ